MRQRAEAEAELSRSFESRVSLSWLSLAAERVWEALLWPGIVVGAFLVVSLLQLWVYLPPMAHRVVLAGFALTLLASLFPLARLTWPTRQDAVRRLERNAGVKHRPASSYEDTISGDADAETGALWAAHRRRLAALLQKLKPSWPEPRNDRRDPYAVRAGLLLMVFVAIVIAGPDSFNRLKQAFAFAPIDSQALLRLDAWVTPPVYTGEAPIVLADGSESFGAGSEMFRALTVPERSELIVRAHAPEGEPVRLTLSEGKNGKPKTIEPEEGRNQLIEYHVPLDKAGTATVEINGQTAASWQFALDDDRAPTISLKGEPTKTPRSALRLSYEVSDDFGVASAEAQFELLQETEDGNFPIALSGIDPDKDPLFEPPQMALKLPKANIKQATGTSTKDLTAHPWAGLRVAMTLVAKDQAGQEGRSEVYEFVLPERQFTKPLAKAVVEQRRNLVRHPDQADQVALALDALTLGADKVKEDFRVFLGLRSAFWRLEDDTSRESLITVANQLWDIALRIEDGDLPAAEQAMKAAKQALEDALKNGASPEEIEQLVDNLRDKLEKYMQQLAQQAQEKGNLPKDAQPQSGEQMVSQQNLDQMLENIKKLAQAGSNEMAEQMLSQLEDVLNRLQTGTFSENAKQQQMQKAMEKLGDLINQQQQLMDETFKKNQQQGPGQNEQFEVSPPGQPMQYGRQMFPELFGQPPQNQQQGQMGQQQQGDQQQPGQQGQQGQMGQQGEGPKGQPGQGQGDQGNDLAQRQGELMDQLQQLMDAMRMGGSEAPSELGNAGDSMGQAQDSLGQNQLGNAAQQQGMALDNMREGAKSLAEQAMQSDSQQQGQAQGQTTRDPLGRPNKNNQPDYGLSVKVPDQIDIQRARQVLDELRRRLGDPQRPMIELEYLERLIRSY
ncbi:TIGR02302 family protein [Methyloligella halotolerans]|nr:TIGR02302 family protein [Methyloligella halotolerans]